jgi:hypothetical protein
VDLPATFESVSPAFWFNLMGNAGKEYITTKSAITAAQALLAQAQRKACPRYHFEPPATPAKAFAMPRVNVDAAFN